MKDERRNIEQERLEQAKKIRENIERRLDSVVVRQQRLEAELELIQRRLERQGGDG